MLIPQEVISHMVGIAPMTLQRAFPKELDQSKARLVGRLKSHILRAERGNLTNGSTPPHEGADPSAVRGPRDDGGGRAHNRETL
jgi:hypothetical protein